jgi:1,2-diacylglycerol 3-beta-glucosyltransferase
MLVVVVGGLVTGSSLGGLIATDDAVPLAVGIWVGAFVFPGIMWGLWHRWTIGDVASWRCLVAGLCYPLFLLIGVVATWRGMARHLRRENAWAKTERLEEEETQRRYSVA